MRNMLQCSSIETQKKKKNSVIPLEKLILFGVQNEFFVKHCSRWQNTNDLESKQLLIPFKKLVQ